MKVLLINGSPRINGNSARALAEMEKTFNAQGVDTELIQVGNQPVRGCIACNSCRKTGKCVFDDIVNETAVKFKDCDGIVVASPVYYASANATLMAFLTRLFFSIDFDTRMKVGAAICCARRGGTTTTYDELNKFFGISGMPIATGQYWNGVHGRDAGEAEQDLEGMQMMRSLARNMTFLMKSIALGKEQFGLPELEPPQHMNFIR